MQIEWLIYLVLFIQLVSLIFIFTKKENRSEIKIQEEFGKLNRDLFQLLSEGRKESSEHLTRQFQFVFDQQRGSAKDQQEALRMFGETIRQAMADLTAIQRERLSELSRKQDELVKNTEARLEKIRETVDEKLQKTLEARLGQSFELVSKQLQAVQQGLGEMQNLANGVGDLKKVLTNVKSRGVLGEYQLQAILENILSPEQYLVNAAVHGTRERVEFAVKLPGQDEPVLLPIDSKFPQEAYLRLVDAYETGDKTQVEISRIELIRAVKKSASDIQTKYIHPPGTTDFAVLFLPVESLYAEILREPGLAQQIQLDFKVIITGPTTLSALLNSLQMGFKTLAIQKRSAEVWQILGAIKNEFGKFGELLERTQRKLNEANSELDKLVGVRTRVIQRKLQEVEELPEIESKKLLED
ncbi:DNA recombination protein RmuC [Algoriphagus sanaruensis]|uniref:Recombinase RmuC n=1 Tax=Algoriphagus sanaruensis TaxID=1727163 RepID=A0A142ENE9_9BACT|nr:DNA recombination protein RmuC [Algoriphagus sanaruensis]AMQ56654.1 recombinase RmuC [Algoriphagus sanaruensis]